MAPVVRAAPPPPAPMAQQLRAALRRSRRPRLPSWLLPLPRRWRLCVHAKPGEPRTLERRPHIIFSSQQAAACSCFLSPLQATSILSLC